MILWHPSRIETTTTHWCGRQCGPQSKLHYWFSCPSPEVNLYHAGMGGCKWIQWSFLTVVLECHTHAWKNVFNICLPHHMELLGSTCPCLYSPFLHFPYQAFPMSMELSPSLSTSFTVFCWYIYHDFFHLNWVYSKPDGNSAVGPILQSF